ncbi:MAG: HEAT repeat domain-containing protein [Proteobacteria bacterium]|nr:HEAT repeat domain-containing protein [Pseudomonadota bacterium]
MLALLALVAAPISLSADGWVTFEQPLVKGVGSMACGRDNRVSLDSPANGWSVNDNDGDPDFETMRVFLQFENGELEEARSFTPDCEVRDTAKAKRIEMAPDEAVELLGGYLVDADERRLVTRLLAIVAQIDHVDANVVLEQAANEIDGRDRSRNALFWLAQRRGEHGRKVVIEHVNGDGPIEHREHAVLALALSKHSEALDVVRAIAREHGDGQLRAHAVTSLGIVKAPGALADLHSIFLVDTDVNVRRQAIFGIAQLDAEGAAETLAAIVRNPQHDAHRRDALFWLANMRGRESEAVMDELMSEVL